MVYISDGILSLPVLAAGWVIIAIFIALALWWSEKKGNVAEEIPKASVMTTAFLSPIPPIFSRLFSKLFFFKQLRKQHPTVWVTFVTQNETFK